jgi:hypothetical protein
LKLYAGADKLVFESGSAIHLLELFGRIKADIAILPRNGPGEAYRRVIQPRVSSRVWLYSGQTWWDDLEEKMLHVRLRRTQLQPDSLLAELKEAKFL